jgi:hypothetical protein
MRAGTFPVPDIHLGKGKPTLWKKESLLEQINRMPEDEI